MTTAFLRWSHDHVHPSSGPAGAPRGPGGALMYDLAAVGLAVACFAFVFVLLRVLEKV
ncbi:MAG TPA: hypothetical protein VHC45_04115 [Gaiellaceae bacterium]|nr:hypothetical protein [Gaiellaceae bacterium]